MGDHAGLSQPPLPLRDTTPSNKDNSSPLLSNNSLIATEPAMDAMEDGKLMPCNTFNKTDKLLSKTTPTLPETEPAEPPPWPLLLVSPKSIVFNPDLLLPLKPPLPLDQPPSPLRPIDQSSKDTPVVSSTLLPVEPNSITPSPLSDIELKLDKTTTSSETHGVHHGETEDTSTSPLLKEPLVSAVSNKPQSGQTPHDHSSDFESNNVIINK